MWPRHPAKQERPPSGWQRMLFHYQCALSSINSVITDPTGTKTPAQMLDLNFAVVIILKCGLVRQEGSLSLRPQLWDTEVLDIWPELHPVES